LELTEVKEELSEDVACEKTLLADDVVTETHQAEEEGQHDETHELDRLAANGVDGSNSDPVTWNGTSTDNDQVANSSLIEVLVHVLGAGGRVADLAEDDRVVERDAVEGDIEEEPRTSSTEQDLSVLPLGVVAEKVTEGGLGDVELTGVVAHGLNTGDLIWNTLGLAGDVCLDIGAGLDDIAADIESVTRSLGDGKTVVKGNAARNGTKTDDDTPHLVDSERADTVAGGRVLASDKGLLEAGSDDESDDTSSELSNTLHGEDTAHHGSTPFGSSESGISVRSSLIISGYSIRTRR